MSDAKNIIESPVLTKEVGEELLSRLDWLTIKPTLMIDISGGLSDVSVGLQQRYPEATLLVNLPSEAASVDLIFANFLLPWHNDLKELFSECYRVLKPNGLIMLSALGPDTLKEWRHVFADEHLPHCRDMHDVGDALVQQGFEDPVLDASHYTLTYKEKKKFISELYASDMLMAPTDVYSAESITMPEEGVLSATFEIIFAHAFAPAHSNEFAASEDGVVSIPLSHLRSKMM
jgi:malonyl-CoA O-methyltransferase